MLVLAMAAAVHGALSIGAGGGYDGEAHVRYAEILRSEGRLPTESESYEFTSPPAYHALAVVLSRAREGAGGDVSWFPAQLLSVVWMVGLLLVTSLLARELWPGRPLLWALAVALTAALPIVIRLATMFHPEMQLAFLVALALLVTVRAHTAGWPLSSGVALGAVLGLAALTRASAAVAVVALAAAVLLAGRRAALRFAAAALVVLLLVAGPWWARQTTRYGNPLESNLDRYILAEGQPASFYLSAPLGDLVLRPYRPHFAGELLPQFHADLWSDWFGAQHDYWREPPSRTTRFFLSSQSLVGLAVAPLALGGLLGLGGAALARVARGRARHRRDFALAASLLLAGLSWAGFLVQLVRYPQAGGDPIKSSYLLYLAPVFALSTLAAAHHLWLRGGGFRVALGALAVLSAASYAGFILTAY